MSRFDEERALPPLWKDGFHPDRLDWYTRLVIESEVIRGGIDVIPEFIAAMLCESGLDNLIVGNNAKNGSSNPYLGIGWCQLDTGYHCKSMEMLHAVRNDAMVSVLYIANNEDLCDQGGIQTHFNEQRWHAWEPEKIDPDTGWNPLKAAHEAWERVNG